MKNTLDIGDIVTKALAFILVVATILYGWMMFDPFTFFEFFIE